MKLVPPNEKILLIPDKVEERTAGGIYLSDQTKDSEQYKMTTGEVVAIGPGVDCCFYDGDLKVGDRIRYNKYSGVMLECDDIEYRAILEDDVHAREE